MDASDNSSDFNDLEVAAVMAFRKTYSRSQRRCICVYSAIIQMHKHLNISIRIYLFYIMVCVLLFCALLRSLRVAHDYDYEQFCLNIFIRF